MTHPLILTTAAADALAAADSPADPDDLAGANAAETDAGAEFAAAHSASVADSD